jgi:hypothetical protein
MVTNGPQVLVFGWKLWRPVNFVFLVFYGFGCYKIYLRATFELFTFELVTKFVPVLGTNRGFLAVNKYYFSCSGRIKKVF